MRKNELTIGFIGGGRITRIILAVWKKHGVSFNRIVFFDPEMKTAKKLESDFPGLTAAESSRTVCRQVDIIIFAIHPPLFGEVLTEIKDSLNDQKLLISLAPKVNFQKIFDLIGFTISAARVIPNAPSFIGEGYNVYALSSEVGDIQNEILAGLFEPLGKWKLVDENKLEAYATITGMGPTYLWFLFQEIFAQAIKCGMSQDEAKDAVNAMIKGASDTLFTSNLEFEEVLDLIPAYPFKPQEENIINAYHTGISGLFKKLSS